MSVLLYRENEEIESLGREGEGERKRERENGKLIQLGEDRNCADRWKK